MTQNEIQQVKSSWAKVAQLDPVVVGGLFYNRLFEIAPEVKPMFQNSIPEQSKKLMAMIGYVIAKLDSLEDILNEVKKLAVRHVHYGVRAENYTQVGTALLWTLEKGLAKDWDEDLKNAWTKCYTILSSAMISAAQDAGSVAA